MKDERSELSGVEQTGRVSERYAPSVIHPPPHITQAPFVSPPRQFPTLAKPHFPLKVPKAESFQTRLKSTPLKQDKNSDKDDFYPYSCEICQKQFKTWSGRYYHMPVHTGKWKHTCFLCDRKFMETPKYNKHLTMHRNEYKGGSGPR